MYLVSLDTADPYPKFVKTCSDFVRLYSLLLSHLLQVLHRLLRRRFGFCSDGGPAVLLPRRPTVLLQRRRRATRCRRRAGLCGKLPQSLWDERLPIRTAVLEGGIL